MSGPPESAGPGAHPIWPDGRPVLLGDVVTFRHPVDPGSIVQGTVTGFDTYRRCRISLSVESDDSSSGWMIDIASVTGLLETDHPHIEATP